MANSTQKKTVSFLAVLSLAASLLGCSQIDFGTSEKLLSKSNVISESFKATGDYSDKSIDVLIVVDNSFSMEEEQQKLGERLDRFVASLRGVDWQIGVTTTDVSIGNYGIQGTLVDLEGASGKILTPQTPNYEQVFLNTITREETLNCVVEQDCPSSDEQALGAILLAIEKRHSDNQGLFREGADLAVIILSDEDEMTDGPEEATKPTEIYDAFQTVFPGKTSTVFGLITLTGDDVCASKNGLAPGVYSTHAEQLADLTGGVVGSICENDYSSTLGQIGERLVTLMSDITLKKAPDPTTLDLRFRPALEDIEYTLEGRKISFSKPLPEDTQILVTYRQVGWDKYLTDEQKEQEEQQANE